MNEPDLRIFSYLPNPRVMKAAIAAKLCNVSLDIVGTKPAELANWLWDVHPRPLEAHEKFNHSPHARTAQRGFDGTLFKTDAFLRLQPFGTVPAAFSPDGDVGIFESNSILRAVARLGASTRPLYGPNDYEASRIDAFLDANLVFAREAQVYLLEIAGLTKQAHARMVSAYSFYMAGVEAALSLDTSHLAGNALSIADISFVCDLAQFLREGHSVEMLRTQGFELISANGPETYPRTFAHLFTLANSPEFAAVLGSYLDWYHRVKAS